RRRRAGDRDRAQLPGTVVAGGAVGVVDVWWKHGAVRVALSWGLAFAYLCISGPGVRVQEDSIHDYSLARRCAEGSGCFAHNPSMVGISQGRLLLMLMAA